MTAPRTLAEVPDAPGGVPLLGHLVTLSRKLPDLLRETALGSQRLLRLRMPFGPNWMLWSSPEALELLSDRTVSAAESAKIGEVIIGHTSMLSSDGDDHRRRRGASNAPFTPKGLTMTGVSDIISDVVVRRVDSMLARGRVRLLDETQALSLEILFRMMGVPRDELGEWVERYTTMLTSALGPRWNVPGTPWARALRARAWVDERLRRSVEAARKDPSSQGLIAELVRGRDDGGAALSQGELLDNLRLMVLAGHETTASVMAWMVAYLVQRPEYAPRLLEETRATPGLPKTPQSLKAFRWAEAFFRESLRLHPPAVLTTRTMVRPLEVEGVQLPAGTVVAIPLWLFSRDPKAFPDPERFDPERWLREDRRLTPLETSAFGAGPHFCLGYHMAWVEAVQFLVALVRAMDDAGLRPSMKRLPRESYLPLLRPRVKDTECEFLPGPRVDLK